jgi:hypothetical protein
MFGIFDEIGGGVYAVGNAQSIIGLKDSLTPIGQGSITQDSSKAPRAWLLEIPLITPELVSRSRREMTV